MNEVKLTPAQVSNLENGITTLQRYLSYIDRLEQCGKDCQYTRQRAQETISRAQELLNKFGPHAQPVG